MRISEVRLLSCRYFVRFRPVYPNTEYQLVLLLRSMWEWPDLVHLLSEPRASAPALRLTTLWLAHNFVLVGSLRAGPLGRILKLLWACASCCNLKSGNGR